MIVADASVVLDLLLGGGSEAGDALARRLREGEPVCAPHLIDAEVSQGLRRFTLSGDLSAGWATSLVQDLAHLPIRRYPHTGLVARAFEFRANATVYDGLYLALAEALECLFVTGDRALHKIPGCKAAVEIVATSA